MQISVAICTWNRADLLDQTLAQMHHLIIPEGVEWELLVVNNNCTDHTDEVIARHASTLPIRRLFEPKQGHSNARNCAIDAARGELLIWTDDDVLVEPNWLGEYWRAACENPEFAYFGGPIDPWFESDPPQWILRHWQKIKGVFVIRDYGPEVRQMSNGEEPAGANMAFRRQILVEHRFDANLGRVGALLTGADDTNAIQRIRGTGHQGLWVGTARVQHFLPAERMCTSFLWNWYHGAGRTHVRMGGDTPCTRIFGWPRWALACFMKARCRSWFFAPFKGERWFFAFRESANLWGYLAEARKERIVDVIRTEKDGELANFK